MFIYQYSVTYSVGVSGGNLCKTVVWDGPQEVRDEMIATVLAKIHGASRSAITIKSFELEKRMFNPLNWLKKKLGVK